ncbi:LAGLIDADG family homing endonuclease [Prescottella subtropica]|uniref:LAGLIDADG family homing endonuclease n=1 Tax=Prescottella subtropica TaxID=2545757 RepID=UPI0010F47306|nr:LAGLIDADG family homing endonuclease [Prescottella subtropica]
MNLWTQLTLTRRGWAKRLLTDWAVLTWTADTTRIGPIPVTALNWVALVGLAAAGYQMSGQRLWIAAAAAAWLLITFVRAATIMPRRRATLDAVYGNLQKVAVLPGSTVSRPVSPSQYLTGIKWASARTFRSGRLTIGATCPAAAAPLLRPHLERAIEQNAPAPAHHEWVFAWPKANTVEFTAVGDDDTRIIKQQVGRRIGDAFKSLFKINPRTAGDGYALDIADWADESRADGETVPIPTRMQFAAGSHDLTDPGFRDSVERGFDRLVSCPGEWIYQWDINGQLLAITREARGSLPARRKLNERKFADDVRSAITKPGKDPVVADVADWADDDSDQPAVINVDFGTLPLGERKVRDRFEDSLDSLMQSRWPDSRLLFDWQFDGGATRLDIESVDQHDDRAKRKSVEKKLRNVVESKFGRASTPVDCDILDWQDGLSATGEALPQIARVNFGAVDVNKRETRDEFQDHWDSLATHNDWHYAWKPAEGVVTMTAVPRLPQQIAFPDPGTPEFDEAIRLARKGILRFGPQKGGGWIDWDLNETPHGLIGGKTGSGKALAATTLVITPIGWRQLGDLRVGDQVFDENGMPTTVTGVYDQPLADTCFEVEFSDGSVVVADDQHLWWTEDRVTRVARTQQRHYEGTRQRRSWLPAETVSALRAAAATARPDETITLPEAAQLARLGENEMGPLRLLAESIGPAEEVRTEDRTYHYGPQVVFQRQMVKVYDGAALTEHLVGKARSPRASKELREHSTGLMAALVELRDRGDGICTHDIAAALGVGINTARNWLRTAASVVPWEKCERLVQLTVAEKTVVRPGPAVRLYPKAALLALAADRGENVLWDQRSRMQLGQVRTTNEIRHTLRAKGGQANHSIPCAKPLQFPDANLPIAPYTLGAWLGDGASRAASITSMDQEIVDRISADGYEVVPGYQVPGAKARSFGIRGIRRELTQLGLRKKSVADGQTKHIPSAYLQASEQQRRDLLAGLLDTDGTASPSGSVQFDNTNEALARGVLELARGLGYRPTMTSKPAMLNGRECGTVYRVSFTTRDKVFGLHRKQIAHDERTRSTNAEKHTHRYITDVRKVAPVPMRCISVDSPARQFLIGEGMIPTHNSVALSIVLFYAMVLPDVYEVIVCDPKRTDFTWTPEFPSVVRFAATDTEIVAAVGLAKQSMDQRQTMLNKLQIRKLQWVRDRYSTDRELEQAHGPVPKRLILFFDEIADFLAKGANSDVEELKDEARADLESIARLGRAIEVNIIAAAQKPDAKIISTQLRSQLGFRLGVGPLDQYESQQILNSDHGTRFPDAGTPKGRSWAYDPKNGYRQTQVFFLPDDSMVCPWDPSATLLGAKDMARDQLSAMDFAQVMVTNSDGGQEPRWVRVEHDAPEPAAEPMSASPELSAPVLDDPVPTEPASVDPMPAVPAVEVAPLSMEKALAAVQASAVVADEGFFGGVTEPELPFPSTKRDATPATPETATPPSVTGIDPWGL